MTVNFKNSAGTDLDNLFYTDNGNAGALGFKNSSGTDLGNKFTAQTTLGYTVGYKNSSGTDMGNLRGASALSISNSVQETSTKCYQYAGGNAESYTYEYYASAYHCNKFTPSESLTQVKATIYITELSHPCSVYTTFSSYCKYNASTHQTFSMSSTGNKTLTYTSDLSSSTPYWVMDILQNSQTKSTTFKVSYYYVLVFTGKSGGTYTYTSPTYSASKTCP